MVDRVTNLFGSNGNDALELLKADHDKVATLFERVRDNEDGNNADIFHTIKEELDLHTHVEEQVFYPHLLQDGDEDLRKIVREGLEEHAQVKTLLNEIAARSGDDPQFKAKLQVLMENVEHHVDEEENEMFPMVRDQISDEMRVRLGSLIEAEKTRFGNPSGRSASA